MITVWSHLKPVAWAAIAVLLILTLARLAMIALWWPRVQAQDALPFSLLQGLRFDGVVLGMLLLLPVLALPLLATSGLALPLWKSVLPLYLTAVLMTVLFLELATPPFAEQFDARPNVLFFEYIKYPREILATLWGAYRVQLLVGIGIVAVVGWLCWRNFAGLLADVRPVSPLYAVPVALLLALGCGMAIRSTFDHRPVNPSTVARTTDALVNEMPLSSLYTLLYAAYELRMEEAGSQPYGAQPPELSVQLVREGMGIDPADFLDTSSTWHRFGPSQASATASATASSRRPKNLVIILEESLGAEFVGSLGGLDLTPNLDRLSADGLWFEELYATGTRSVRGIEAVVTGFLPTPTRSVVKLAKSQRNFFTLASFLREQGYATSFIYGGEAHFDNMRRFFMGNGFDAVVDQKDYVNPVFTGSWGVSDEDLMQRAHEEFEAAGERPFFSLVFSSSNHTPFEFPDGRIELHDAEKQTVNNAVKYADYAIGYFFERAMKSRYWDDTLFLVVADHNSRVYGDSLVPIDRFHIPGLILGGGVTPGRYTRVASQVDLAPTLLSMMGLSGVTPMPGRDLTALPDAVPGRAIMQFNAIQAYREDDDVVVLQRNLAPLGFHYADGQLTEAPVRQDLVDKALAHVNWAVRSYQDGTYTASPPAASVATGPTEASNPLARDLAGER